MSDLPEGCVSFKDYWAELMADPVRRRAVHQARLRIACELWRLGCPKTALRCLWKWIKECFGGH